MTRAVDPLVQKYQERASEHALIIQQGHFVWGLLRDDMKQFIEEVNRHTRNIVLVFEEKNVNSYSIRRQFDRQTLDCWFEDAEHTAYFNSEKPKFHYVMRLEVRGGKLSFLAPSSDGSYLPRTPEDIAFEVLSNFLSK